MEILRAVAIFCEDLREEKSGQDILIGTMSDNIALPSIPAMLGKLAVYLRVYFATSSKPEAINAWVQLPWGQRFDLGAADERLMKGALEQASAQKAPFAGVILKGLFQPLPIPQLGAITAHIKIGDQEYLCGMLNLVLDPSLFANASPPPS
jgi:hypothetical protein